MATEEHPAAYVTLGYMNQAPRYLAHDIGVAATRFQRAMSLLVGIALEPFDLTAAEYGVLDHVRSNPGVSNAELARYLLITPQALGRISTGLQERGYIRRTPTTGGRRSPIAVTAEGLALSERIKPVIDHALRALFASVEAVDLSVLLQTLTLAADSVDQ